MNISETGLDPDSFLLKALQELLPMADSLQQLHLKKMISVSNDLEPCPGCTHNVAALKRAWNKNDKEAIAKTQRRSLSSAHQEAVFVLDHPDVYLRTSLKMVGGHRSTYHE